MDCLCLDSVIVIDIAKDTVIDIAKGIAKDTVIVKDIFCFCTKYWFYRRITSFLKYCYYTFLKNLPVLENKSNRENPSIRTITQTTECLRHSVCEYSRVR